MEKHQTAIMRARLRAMQDSCDHLYHRTMSIRDHDPVKRDIHVDVLFAHYLIELAELNQCFTDVSRLYFDAANDKEVLSKLAAVRIAMTHTEVEQHRCLQGCRATVSHDLATCIDCLRKQYPGHGAG
jgi:hypothetical protein